MREDMIRGQKLKEAGMADELLAQYQRHLDSGNRQGQERLLCRFRCAQRERLTQNREKLACLDYIMAKVEKSGDLFGGKDGTK